MGVAGLTVGRATVRKGNQGRAVALASWRQVLAASKFFRGRGHSAISASCSASQLTAPAQRYEGTESYGDSNSL